MPGNKYNFKSIEDEKKKLVWSGTQFEKEAAEEPEIAKKVLLDMLQAAAEREADRIQRPRFDPRHHGGKEL